MKLKLVIMSTIAIITVVLLFSLSSILNFKLQNNSDSAEITKLSMDSLFDVYGINQEYHIDENGKRAWTNLQFQLKSENKNLYDELMYESHEKTVVIYPILTESAYYSEHGFYDYYTGECDKSCLTVKIQKGSNQSLFNSSGIGFQILKLLNYETLTDIDIDKNPEILKKYDKVIVLHNEYVTKKEFNAITSHPKVIYLYPNSLYAEVAINYLDNSSTLIRGHGFPDIEISNGFDWKFDNSKLEYNIDCKEMGFYKIDNGFMLNCYPEHIIHKSYGLLKSIKDL